MRFAAPPPTFTLTAAILGVAISTGRLNGSRIPISGLSSTRRVMSVCDPSTWRRLWGTSGTRRLGNRSDGRREQAQTGLLAFGRRANTRFGTETSELTRGRATATPIRSWRDDYYYFFFLPSALDSCSYLMSAFTTVLLISVRWSLILFILVLLFFRPFICLYLVYICSFLSLDVFCRSEPLKSCFAALWGCNVAVYRWLKWMLLYMQTL